MPRFFSRRRIGTPDPGPLPAPDTTSELAAWLDRSARELRALSALSPGAGDPRLARMLSARARLACAPGSLDRRPIAVAGPLAEVIEAWRRRVEAPAGSELEREILYIEDGGGDWLTAFIDRALFVLVADELIENVLHHGATWNRITVTTEPVPGAILVRVRDDGGGIPADLVRRFEGGDPLPATGLGLVAGIARAHGGRISLASHAGAGSVVSVWWPVPPS